MNSAARVALSLGGNLGDVRRAFVEAVAFLESAGLNDLRRSSIYRTKPVGFSVEVPDFLNAVVTGVWVDAPEKLHLTCKHVEKALGRPEKHDSWTSRTIDIDIVLFGDAVVSTPALTIPHPEAKNRFFVLSPLCEVAADWIFPDSGSTVRKALDELKAKAPDDEVLALEVW